jgi:lambda repressor-like predicted transcriptional regulator
MSLSRRLQKFPSLKLEFLLPLPLILIAFGLGGESLTNKLLSRSYTSLDKLLADIHSVEVKFAVNVQVVEAEIEQEEGFTIVELKTANSVLKKLKFELPTAESSKVEAGIAKELGLSSEIQPLQAGTQMQVQLGLNVIAILAEIEKEQGFTKVEVKTADSVLKELNFQFPVTELSRVKTIIAQELGLTPKNTWELISYRVKK